MKGNFLVALLRGRVPPEVIRGDRERRHLLTAFVLRAFRLPREPADERDLVDIHRPRAYHFSATRSRSAGWSLPLPSAVPLLYVRVGRGAFPCGGLVLARRIPACTPFLNESRATCFTKSW